MLTFGIAKVDPFWDALSWLVDYSEYHQPLAVGERDQGSRIGYKRG